MKIASGTHWFEVSLLTGAGGLTKATVTRESELETAKATNNALHPTSWPSRGPKKGTRSSTAESGERRHTTPKIMSTNPIIRRAQVCVVFSSYGGGDGRTAFVRVRVRVRVNC